MNNIPDKKDFTDEDIERLMAKIRKEKLEEIDDFKGTDQKITSEIFTMCVHLYLYHQCRIIQ